MSRDPDEWHLAINQTGWHLALTCQGAFKLRPWQVTPRDSARVYPGMIRLAVFHSGRQAQGQVRRAAGVGRRQWLKAGCSKRK